LPTRFAERQTSCTATLSPPTRRLAKLARAYLERPTMQTLLEMLAGAIGALFLWFFFFVLFLF
jgi:hypothetical protein